ncbi:MAG TPA: hypothetical protein VGO62_10565, partial [Myxococcota bacterium]
VVAVFQRGPGDPWQRSNEIGAVDVNGSQFGASVALSSTRLAVGAPAINAVVAFDVSAAPFVIANLVDGFAGSFGAAVALSDNTLVVGAPTASPDGAGGFAGAGSVVSLP